MKKEFQANVKIVIDVYVPLSANTLEEALTDARTIKSPKDMGIKLAAGVEVFDWDTTLIGVSEVQR